MKLTDLDPQWYGAGGSGIYAPTGRPCPVCPPAAIDPECRTCFGQGLQYVPAPERHGVGLSFLCPCSSCTAQRTGDEDKDFHLRHYIPFENPLDGGPALESGHPKWRRDGDTFDTLRLSPSILSDKAKGGCGWHGHIGLHESGEVTTC